MVNYCFSCMGGAIHNNKNFGIYFGLGLFLRNFVNSKIAALRIGNIFVQLCCVTLSNTP